MKCPVCKKNISQDTLKCPYCKSRTGLLCSHCNTINSIKNLTCKTCGSELLKICKKCSSINFPSAVKCRKCGSEFSSSEEKKKNSNQKIYSDLEYKPQFYSSKSASNILTKGLQSKDTKIFSINGPKGCGKTSVLKNVIKNFNSEQIQWCIGRCSHLTQITPGGVIQDMMLNLFRLPHYALNTQDLKSNAEEFFSKEFQFLNKNEINDFFNFIYNHIDGNYEDIIINKKRTYGILNKIFEAFVSTGKFIFVFDNFDYIDGFSAEFLTNFVQKEKNQKNLKFIVLYNEYQPVSAFFEIDSRNKKSSLDISLSVLDENEIYNILNKSEYLSKREKELIFRHSEGNLAYAEQACAYAFDCQINDKVFILPKTFEELVKTRLETLKKSNIDAYKILCTCAILGNKINLNIIQEIFENNITDIISYLVKSRFISQCDDIFYEFNNMSLWEAVLKKINHDSIFNDINIKTGKIISLFNLNTNSVMTSIAQNLKETRMSFDIWTKTTRLASYLGDINLYVIAQKQCLALLNEFSENETLKIRYSISEKLGKLLTEYDPEEALEYLPDAISNAQNENDETKEIELLGYLTSCCQKTGNYFGNVECSDKVLKKLDQNQNLERAMVLSSKLSALLDIGNCGEVINLIDNDILPILNTHLSKPKLSKLFPMGIVFDTWLKVYLSLATALAMQGNNRAFEVLRTLFSYIDKYKINDAILIYRTKLVQAYAYTMAGNFKTSEKIIENINSDYGNDFPDLLTLSRRNLIHTVNRLFTKDYEGIKQDLFEAVTFANNTGDNFTKNILKSFLGKIFKDNKQTKHAIDIYNEQISWFAKEKIALGALLTWYFIADATIVLENSRSAIDIAQKALEIAQNPSINNFFFITCLKIVLAKAYINIGDYETAKINIESGLVISKKYFLNDMSSRFYLLYGDYYKDMGSIDSPNQLDYLRASAMMYEKAMELVVKETENNYIKNSINYSKNRLNEFCKNNELFL